MSRPVGFECCSCRVFVVGLRGWRFSSRTTDSSMNINDYLGFREQKPVVIPHFLIVGGDGADDTFFTFFTRLWFQILFVFSPNPGDTWSNLTSAYFSNGLIQPPSSDWIQVEIIGPLWIFGILMTKSVVAIGTASVCKNEPQNQQNPNGQRRFLNCCCFTDETWELSTSRFVIQNSVIRFLWSKTGERDTHSFRWDFMQLSDT